MKLLLENWRRYLTEQQGRRLSVFDFDDTIAQTGNIADAFDKETGEFVKRLDTEETELAKKTGTVGGTEIVLDFSDFDSEVRGPVGENLNITRIIRDRLADSSTQVMVMTARAPESEEPIQNYLNTLDPPIPTDNMIIKGVAGGNKGRWIGSYLLENPSFTEVEFYDDQDKNINNVLAAAAKMPNITFSVYKVVHGEIKAVS